MSQKDFLWRVFLVILVIFSVVEGKKQISKKNRKLQNKLKDFSVDNDDIGNEEIVEQEFILPPWVETKSKISTESTVPPPPDCIRNESDIVYVNGQISATQTFLKCLSNIAEPVNLPTLYNGAPNGIVTIWNSIQLNNLQGIDAVGGTASLDFYLRLFWQDNRFNMPLFWAKMDPKIRRTGFELTLLQNTVDFWHPDIRFHDAADLNYLVETIRFNSSNVFFWSRHTVTTFSQQKMKFTEYPGDSQQILIRFGSYAYDKTWLNINFLPGALSFNENFDKSKTFLSNPSWEFLNTTMTNYTTYTSSSGFINAIYHIGVKRRGGGIVLRLILPVTLLCFLGGLTFWSEYSGRVDITVNLLLAVSALYIVILANIPLVGYLTSVDTYIFWMFLLLVFAVILHQFYARIKEGEELWPMRIFLARIIEFIGRLTIFPIVTILFLLLIKDVDHQIREGLIIVLIIIWIGIFFREIRELIHSAKESTKKLIEKINDDELLIKELSSLEILFVNIYEFKKFSFSPFLISDYLNSKEVVLVPGSKSIPLRRYSKVIGDDNSSIMFSPYPSNRENPFHGDENNHNNDDNHNNDHDGEINPTNSGSNYGFFRPNDSEDEYLNLNINTNTNTNQIVQHDSSSSSPREQSNGNSPNSRKLLLSPHIRQVESGFFSEENPQRSPTNNSNSSSKSKSPKDRRQSGVNAFVKLISMEEMGSGSRKFRDFVNDKAMRELVRDESTETNHNLNYISEILHEDDDQAENDNTNETNKLFIDTKENNPTENEGENK